MLVRWLIIIYYYFVWLSIINFYMIMNYKLPDSPPEDEKSRPYICPCGKSYLSYPALFTHIKQKHDGKVTNCSLRHQETLLGLNHKIVGVVHAKMQTLSCKEKELIDNVPVLSLRVSKLCMQDGLQQRRGAITGLPHQPG